MTELIARLQEQELECLGMAWYRSLLVLAVKRHPHESYQVSFCFHFLCYLRCLQGATHHTARHTHDTQILFYPRRYLSARALVHRVKLSPKCVPHLLAVRNDSLIVLTRYARLLLSTRYRQSSSHLCVP
jgi:hypothetical protein